MSPLGALLFITAITFSICNLSTSQVTVQNIITPNDSGDEYMPFIEGNVDPDPLPFEATIEHAFILGTPEEIEAPHFSARPDCSRFASTQDMVYGTDYGYR